MSTKGDTMGYRRRLIGCAMGTLMVATWATGIDAGAASPTASGDGCRGLSPASSQDCTAEQLRASLERF